MCYQEVGADEASSYFFCMAASTHWTRYPKTRTAVRGENGDRITLMLQRGGWVALVGTNSHYLEASTSLSLDEVIVIVDQLFPPAGWLLEGGALTGVSPTWSRPGWSIWEHEAGAWYVGRVRANSDEVAVRATSKVFKTADRARSWVEVRLERTNMNLRGPRPRAEERAVKTFPDVRVTQAERDAAVAMSSRLQVSFSDLARAALKFIEAETAEGGRITLTRAGSQGGLRFSLRE